MKHFPFKEPAFLLFQILNFTLFFRVLLSVDTPSDYSSLVYTNCTAKASQDSLYSEYLSSLFQELVAKSSELKFYKTTMGGTDEDGDGSTTGISGLYQCRGDLSSSECNGCITKLPEISDTLCGSSDTARIQLSGCYVCYETDGYRDDGRNDGLLYKKCSDEKAPGDDDDGFRKARDSALSAAVTGVVDDDGYYSGSSDDKEVHVVAQCQGDLGDCECGECVNAAVQFAEDECGNSVKGEIYLNKCSLSYAYKRHAKPKSHDGPKPGKKLAMAVGGVAALCAVSLFCLLLKNSGRKDDDC